MRAEVDNASRVCEALCSEEPLSFRAQLWTRHERASPLRTKPKRQLSHSRKRHPPLLFVQQRRICCAWAVIFTILNCRPFPHGEWRLVADLDVVCTDVDGHMSPEYAPYVYAALIFIIIIPVGVPGGLFGYLYVRHDDLFEEDPDNPGEMRPTVEPKHVATKHLSTMYKKYEPWTFYFEAIHLAFKAVFAGPWQNVGGRVRIHGSAFP